MMKGADSSQAKGECRRRNPSPAPVGKRAQSAAPLRRPISPELKAVNRRATSLSPTSMGKCLPRNLNHHAARTSTQSLQPHPTTAETGNKGTSENGASGSENSMPIADAGGPLIPHCVLIKMQRQLAMKKRDFAKLRKELFQQQKTVLQLYANIRDLESRAGGKAEPLGDVRVLSVTSWPAHDLLLLVRDDVKFPIHADLSGIFGPQILQQVHNHLNPIPEEVLNLCAELMARRIDILNLMRGKRNERAYTCNLDWKPKSSEFDTETERLHRTVAGAVENIKAKINFALELAKVPWIDRDTLVKKNERLQKDNLALQFKLEEKKSIPDEGVKKVEKGDEDKNSHNSVQKLQEELAKERAARDSLKEVVSAAESMLRVARTRIAALERQLKDAKNEIEVLERKHKDLEQLCRFRETSYDVRSKKLLEVSKTGEITIEALSRQRDALELRVKELREQAETAEKLAESREADLRTRAEALHVKLLEQEKKTNDAEARVGELENKQKELEETIVNLRERSGKLVDLERKRCLEYIPAKESEPTTRETEIWKELQATRVALNRAEDELRHSRADKENFLVSLSKIAQEGSESIQEKMATELLEKEQKIVRLQNVIEEQRENEKLMEQSMTQYEDQLANLRLEVKRLRNYDCYSKELSYQELQTELLELHMRVDTLTRERRALVTAAASRTLMLERHERSADLFARLTRARRELAALLEGQNEPPLPQNLPTPSEISRSLTSVCMTSAETWTALRAERERVLRLESAVLTQSLQLEREGRVRTQLERRRALLERQVLRAQSTSRATPISDPTSFQRHA